MMATDGGGASVGFDVVAEAGRIARVAAVLLDAGYAQCAYVGCRQWVQPRYLYCKRHAIEVGLVRGRRLCRGITASGKPCSRMTAHRSGYCWQHRRGQGDG